MFDNLLINLKLNTQGMGQWYNTTKKMNQTLSNINKDANRSAEGIAKLTGSLGGMNQIIGIGKLALLGTQLAKTIQGALDMTETVNLFSVAMGDTAVETNKFVQEMAKAYGLDSTNLQNAIGTFGLLSRSMGMSTNQSEVLSTNMSKLAVDLASLTNVPINQVMADLKSGLVGQSETVYKYGMDVTEAGIKAEAMNQGITKSVRDMNQGEKMALRYSAMIRQSTLAQGDFANTINSPANQLKILSERFITLGRSIGSMFMPMLSAVLPYLNAFVQILIDVADAIAKFFGFKPPEVKNGVAKSIGDISEGADDSTKAVDGTTKALKKMKNATMGFDEINLMPQQPSDSGAGGKGGAGGGASILPKFDFNGYNNGLDSIKAKADELKQSILDTIKTFTDFVTSLPIEPIIFLATALGSLWLLGGIGSLGEVLLGIAIAFEGFAELPIIGGFFAVLTECALDMAIAFEGLGLVIAGLSAGAMAVIVGAIALVTTTIVSLWNNSKEFRDSWIEVWNNIQGAINNVWTSIIQPILNSLISTFKLVYDAGLKPLWDVWLMVWNNISGIITTILNGALFPLFKVLVGWIKDNIIPIVQALLPIFGVIFSGILGVVTGVFRSIAEIFDGFKNILQGVINFVTGVFTGNWSRAFGGLRDIIVGIFKGLEGVLSIPLNGMIDGVNAMIRGINKIQLPDWDIIPSAMRGKGFNISQIPRLARGGMVESGSIFQAGEMGAEMIGSYNGQTTVMPLENTSFVSAMYDAVYGAVANAMQGASGGSGQEIVLKVGSTEFGRVAIDSINKITKQEGRLALNI